MHGWRNLIGSTATVVVAVVALSVFPDGAVELSAGMALLLALAILARSALRLAGRTVQGNRPAPPGRG